MPCTKLLKIIEVRIINRERIIYICLHVNVGTNASVLAVAPKVKNVLVHQNVFANADVLISQPNSKSGATLLKLSHEFR